MVDAKLEIGTGINLSGIKKDIKALEKELSAVQKEIDELNAKEIKVSKEHRDSKKLTGVAEEDVWKKAAEKRTAKELQSIHKAQRELNDIEQEYISKIEQANALLQQQSVITQAGKELDGAVKTAGVLDKIQTEEQYQSMLARTKAQMERISAEAEKIATKHGLSKEQLLSTNKEYQRLSDLLTQLDGKQGQFKKRAGDAMKSAQKGASAFGTAIKKNIKQIAKMGLAMLGARSAFNAFRKAINSYTQSNEQLKNQLDSLWNVAGQAVGPFVEAMVKGISTLVVWVNTLVEALSGINLIAKANAAALKKQASAAKSASLAGFDEMNKLSDDSGSQTTGLFDTSMAGDVPKFLEDMKQKILEGDWYGAGEVIGEAIMDGIKGIDWSSLGTNLGEILGNVTAFALGLALNIDPLVVLGAIARLASGLMEALSTTIQELDWAEIGADIVDILIQTLMVSLITTDPFATLIALIFTPEGQDLTSSASELVGSIIGALVSAVVGSALRIGEIGMEIWNGIKGWVDENIDWDATPEEIINGLFEGIKTALKFVGDWVYNNIWIPFRDGFKEAFDIHSPSKKMEDFGEQIIDGLCGGITGAIDKVRLACVEIWNTIKGRFSNVGSWFKEKFSEAWQKVKDVFSTGGKIFDGIKEGIGDTFKTIVNGLIDGINKVIRVPFNSINGMLNTIRGIEVMGVSPFKNLWGYNPLSIPQIPKLALGGIVNRPGRGVPAIIGEAGAEAVLPLENNTEWMDILAEKIGGNVTIPIYMDGKKIATYVVDIQKKRAFALNGV